MQELVTCRKALGKSKADSLIDGKLYHQAFDLALEPYPDDCHLELLSFLVVLFRQLKATLVWANERPEAEAISEMVHARLAPAIRPGESIADIISTNMDSSHKTAQLRAGDVLLAACRMADSLPPPASSGSTPTSILDPLFTLILDSGTSSRLSLVTINIMIEHVSPSTIPVNILDDMLHDLDSMDSSSLRCSIIVKLLPRRRGTVPSDVEETKERYRLEKLIPYFDSSRPPMTLTNLTRYLLPMLFKAHPSSAKELLQILGDPVRKPSVPDSDSKRIRSPSQDKTFSSWVSVASLAVSLGHVDIEDLPELDLSEAVAHEDPDVRLRAFHLLAGVKDLLRPRTMDLTKESMRWNATLPSAGSRSEFASAVHSFFTRLKTMQEIDSRRETKEAKLCSDIVLNSTINYPQTFRLWFLDKCIDPGLDTARRYPVVEAILALSLLGLYLDIFGGQAGIQENVFTSLRVSALFACQASEFSEVRSRARAILESAVIPLPGYEHLATGKTQTLLASAFASLSHPRNTQAEAGKASLCIIFEKLVQGANAGGQAGSVDFVSNIVDSLDAHLREVEFDLAKRLEDYPLHGHLAAIRDIVGCIRLESRVTQSAMRPLFHRLLEIVNRVWAVTSRVISLALTEPHDDDENHSNRADHEIARAHEVLGGTGDMDDEDESVDYTNLLSGCWRGSKEAGDLLAMIFVLPLSTAGSARIIWNKDEVDKAGQFFLTLLHEVRHRGTFSKIALAFARLVDAVKSVEGLADLRRVWLDQELEIIAQDSISTTRRSAALPYSVLSIVSGDRSLLDHAFDHLITLTRSDNENLSDMTRVHTFNILKIVFLDARQSKEFDRYFERALMAALQAFSSPDWNVRNVGLILFSTLAHRSLALGRSSQDFYRSRAILGTRQTLNTWHTRYPSIIPFMTDYLHRMKTDSVNISRTAQHSPLFPILIIIRSLRYSVEGKQLQDALLPEVLPYLSSPEWQVRGVAAQAVSSLMSPSEALNRAMAFRLRSGLSSSSPNMLHGQILLLRHLIAEVIDWRDDAIEIKVGIEAVLSDLIQNPLMRPRCSLVTKAALDCISAYCESTKQASPALIKSAIGSAEAILRTKPSTSFPGHSLLRETYASIICVYGHPSEILRQLLSPLSGEDETLVALEHLDSCGISPDLPVLQRLLALAASDQSEAIQAAAIRTLVCTEWDEAAITSVQGATREKFCTHLFAMVRRTSCVPLREAGLPALGWATAWTFKVAPPPVTANASHLGELAYLLLDASEEDQSQPARWSALQCITHLTRYLFPSYKSQAVFAPILSSLHLTLLRLLQDDDVEIRLGTARIVSLGLGNSRPVVHAMALDIWWKWLDGYVQESDGTEGWISWLWELCIDAKGFDFDLATIEKAATNPFEVLFEVEPPNLFRDALIDCENATSLLTKLDPSDSSIAEHRATLIAFHSRAEAAIASLDHVSPIDDAWERRRVLMKRMDIQRRALTVLSSTKE